MRESTYSPAVGVEFAAAGSPFPGEVECGDRHIVVPHSRGALLAVVDGLGHGAEASKAAAVAEETLRLHAEESVISLVRRCHERLLVTRGVAMSLASLNAQDNTLTVLSVGNVEGVLLRYHNHQEYTDEAFLMRGGVVGFNLPPLQAIVFPLLRGDMVIFATDGIQAGFASKIHRNGNVEEIADQIFKEYRRGNDDSLVLVVRYIGRSE